MLPQIALGHAQSFILSSTYFESNILNLNEIMIPPLMSSTLNSEIILDKNNNSSSKESKESKSGGRPSLPENEKSDKTLANEESTN